MALLVDYSKFPGLKNYAIQEPSAQDQQEFSSQFEMLVNCMRSVSDSIAIIDNNRKILFVNEAFLRLFGFSEEEVLGQTLEKIQGYEDESKASLVVHESFQKGFKGELLQKKKDGTIFYIDLTTTPVRDASGEVKYVMGVARDISEQKLSEILLQDQDEMLTMTGQIAKVGGWYYNPQTNTGKWTDQIFSIHEFDSSAEVKVDDLLTCYSPDQMEILKDTMIKAASGNKQFDISLKITTKKGNLKWVRMVGFLEIDRDTIIFVKGTIQDITSQKKIEEELIRSRQRFQGYFENSVVGVCVTSPAKGWIEVNDSICRMFGYSKEELYKMTWAELTHPDDLESDILLFNKLMAGEIRDYELSKRFIGKNGNIIYTIIYITAVRNPDGTVDHIVGSIADITGRKIAEEKSRLNERKLREISYMLPFVIFESDISGKLTYINKAGKDWFGYTDKEVDDGLNVINFINENERSRSGKKIPETDQRKQHKFHRRIPSDKKRRFRFSGPYNINGN